MRSKGECEVQVVAALTSRLRLSCRHLGKPSSTDNPLYCRLHFKTIDLGFKALKMEFGFILSDGVH